MNPKNFNLIDDPWIPVRWRNGRQNAISLQEAFVLGTEIADLACAPHERVSLIRLLVCITQAALGAPADPFGWRNWGHNMATRVPEYLTAWRDHFNLFGTNPRFLQVAVPAKGNPVPASKLIPHLATGNNPTVFDHLGGSTRSLPPNRLALALLSFQMFYPLYGAGYKGKGPCVDGNMVHAILLGEHLDAIIRSNCLDESTIRAHFPTEMGRPIWELDETKKNQIEIATQSYLGRLVPRHRNLWLLEDGSGFHLTTIGLTYSTYPAAIEPSATIVIRKKGSEELPFPLSARLDRALWRDLHALAVERESTKNLNAAPLVLQTHIEDFVDADLALWTGALVTDLKAKILDTIESTFTTPAKLFRSVSAKNRYGNGVEHAETLSKRLYGAVKTYASALKHESPPIEAAQRHYWNTLNQRANVLIGLVRLQGMDDDPMGAFSFGDRHEDGSFDLWTKLVRSAVNDAYRKTCAAQTPRQMKAFAAGLRVLTPKTKAKTTSAQPITAS